MVTLTRNEYDVLVLALSWVVGFLPLFAGRRMTWVQAVGLGLLATPFVRFALDIAITFERLFTFTVLQPVSAAALWNGVLANWIENIAFPLVGILLLHNAMPGWPSRRAPRLPLRGALRAHGLAPRRSWRRDFARGLSLFFAIALAYVAAYVLSKTVFAVLSTNGIETGYWRNITIPLILLVSATAGIGEELLFRGVLLTALLAAFEALRPRWALWRRAPTWAPAVAASLVQALVFAFIHAGYGTWTHVAGPFAFGLGMAWVARKLGVVVTALLHAEVNVVFFAIEVAPDYVAANGALGVAGLALLLGGLAAASVASLVLTRADAYRILGKSILSPLHPVEPDEAPDVVVGRT